MKELSIKEKAKAYDEALARMSRAFNSNRCTLGFMNEIFPELKESDDERIKKELINYFIKGKEYLSLCNFSKEDILAWLEKQGEKDEEILVLKDQIESLHAAIKAIKETHRIELERQGKEEYALKSFKDEDVRKFMQCIEKQAKAYEFNLPNRGYDIYAFAKDILVWLEKQGEQKPIIEMKSAEESLGIDSVTYNKIVDECIYGEQKPADKVEPKFNIGDEIKTSNEEPLTITKIDEKGYWSEDLFICDFDEECLWDLVEKKPAWNEEDEHRVKDTIYFLDTAKKHYASTVEIDACIDWLKSLKPQNKWKPSEEQLKALDDFIYSKYPNTEKHGKAVKSLYQDLKKLKA